MYIVADYIFKCSQSVLSPYHHTDDHCPLFVYLDDAGHSAVQGLLAVLYAQIFSDCVILYVFMHITRYHPTGSTHVRNIRDYIVAVKPL